MTDTTFDTALRRCRAAFANTDRSERMQAAAALMKACAETDDPRRDLAGEYAAAALRAANGDPGGWSSMTSAAEQLLTFEDLLDDLEPPAPPSITVY